ncbi:MAG: hypothetical protein CBB65_10200 [Hyphomonadaceae bacterium TMED5]|nr:hypothetical protein [Ponticaulis sp.]OUX99025.1 MAG: hypothetical protein CBB65_10200 [Hyphomonadaceae bacterium TMED5]|tara:strand:+ start:84046 stop:84930 length:885 start_codon:yes stop_codon:yes gene_type:complete
MHVSWRHTLTVGTALVLTSLVGVANAQSDCCSSCCTGGEHDITPPGISVPGPNIVYAPGSARVGTQVIVGGSSSSSSYSASADSRTVFYANGSYIPMADPIPQTTLSLNVAGSQTVEETVEEQVAVQEEICVPRMIFEMATVPVQATCFDDTGVPHPASRVDDAELVSTDFTGELYRCMAGTSMQVTIGEMVNGAASFQHASSFTCARGEALAMSPLEGLVCAPQIPQRDCNERSLLRRYGPGIKIVEARVEREICEPQLQTRYETVERQVMVERALPPSSITLDGGVGQYLSD